MQDAAEKLGEDAGQYDKENPGAMVEIAKKIARMWMKMAQLLRFTVSSETSCISVPIIFHSLMIFRKECILKEREFKEDIVDLAKRINKESQEVMRIAGSIAEACTDKIMRTVSHDRLYLQY